MDTFILKHIQLNVWKRELDVHTDSRQIEHFEKRGQKTFNPTLRGRP